MRLYTIYYVSVSCSTYFAGISVSATFRYRGG